MSSLLLIAALTTTANAQDGGFDGHGYTQVPSDGDVDDAVNLWVPEAQEPGTWGIEALLEYSKNNVVLIRGLGDNETRTPLLTNTVGVNLGGHVSMSERVAAALSMPVWFTAGGDRGDGGPTVADMRLAVPVGIVLRDPDASSFGLSVVPALRLPTGNTQRLLGDPGVGGEIVLAPGWGNDTWSITGNIGAGFGSSEAFENLSPGNHLMLGLAGGWHFEDRCGLQLEAWMNPALKGSEVSGKGSPGEVAISARGKLMDTLTGTLSLQTAVTPGAGASQFRLLAGVVVNTKNKPKDTDRDGITDEMDTCPTEPETFNSYNDDDGCPDQLANLAVTVLDPNNDPMSGVEVRVNGDLLGVTDGSGQLMVTDRLPGNAEITVTDPTGQSESQSQSMELPEGSSNAAFSQIWLPGTIRVMARDGNGDPVDAAISWTGDEGSGDGTLGTDGSEILVLGPGTWDLFARADGFKPEQRAVELAPNEHSLQVIELSLLPATAVVTETSIIILDAINFEVNSAELTAASQPIVDEVATNLLLAPEIVQLEVQGHTDSQGSSAYNRDLSQRRVDSVLAAIVSRGVATSRLSAIGFGEDCSVADNGTAAGRARNRRVQFFITDPAPANGVPCHDGRPGQETVESIELDRQVEVEQ